MLGMTEVSDLLVFIFIYSLYTYQECPHSICQGRQLSMNNFINMNDKQIYCIVLKRCSIFWSYLYLYSILIHFSPSVWIKSLLYVPYFLHAWRCVLTYSPLKINNELFQHWNRSSQNVSPGVIEITCEI